MLRLTSLNYNFSTAAYHKAIARLGINTERLVLNPTYSCFLFVEFHNSTKSHSSTNRHQTPSPDLHSCPRTVPFARTQASKQAVNPKTRVWLRIRSQPKPSIGETQTSHSQNRNSTWSRPWPKTTSTTKTAALSLMGMQAGIPKTRSRSEPSVPELITLCLWETC